MMMLPASLCVPLIATVLNKLPDPAQSVVNLALSFSTRPLPQQQQYVNSVVNPLASAFQEQSN